MGEEEFTNKLLDLLETALKKEEDLSYIKIEKKRNLLYKVIVDRNIEFKPNNPRDLRRGNENYAFQTDLVISTTEGLPLVVVEIKYRQLTTHDILTYSAKAIKHKEIYPYLRYGLLIGETDKIPNRFFTHNSGFDFAYAMKDLNKSNFLEEFINLIKQQIKSAYSLLNTLEGRKDFRKFTTVVEID